MHMYVFMYTDCILCPDKGQKRACDSLEKKLMMVVSMPVGAEKL